MEENVQFTVNKIDELRKNLDDKIDKKLDSTPFWWILLIIAGAIGTGFYWQMSMNERITRVETRIDDIKQHTTPPLVSSSPSEPQ